MNRLGLGASIGLIAVGAGILRWSNAHSNPASVPWAGVYVVGAGFIGLILCILAGLMGSGLKVIYSPQGEAGGSASRAAQHFNNYERTPTMSGKFDEAKGRAKEAAGDLTGNKDLKREGKTDQASGKVKQKVEGAKDWVEDKIDDARDKVD